MPDEDPPAVPSAVLSAAYGGSLQGFIGEPRAVDIETMWRMLLLLLLLLCPMLIVHPVAEDVVVANKRERQLGARGAAAPTCVAACAGHRSRL